MHNKITILKIKQPRLRLLHLKFKSDKPLSPTLIDDKIANNKGKTIAIEAINESLQASKNITTPSLLEIIKHKTKESGRL
jgi:hypothetical protein